jgi:hypothetical protein
VWGPQEIHSLPQAFLFDRYLVATYKGFVTEALDMRPVSWVVLILMFSLSSLILVYAHSEVRALPSQPLSPAAYPVNGLE